MPDELRQKAIRLLARREHTRAELTRKLAAYGTPEEIATLLADMQAAQLQSDTRAAESYVRSHAARLGAARLRQNLKTRGVASELIDAQLARIASRKRTSRRVAASVSTARRSCEGCSRTGAAEVPSAS